MTDKYDNDMASLRAKADAGDRNAAGRLGELLAGSDPEGALQVWARSYGEQSTTTKRLAELYAERGDLRSAVSAWKSCDAVWQNPAGLHSEYMAGLDPETRLEESDAPEDWGFIEREELVAALARWGDEAAIAELRQMAAAGDHLAVAALRKAGR